MCMRSVSGTSYRRGCCLTGTLPYCDGYHGFHGYPEILGFLCSASTPTPPPPLWQVWSVTPVWQPQAKGKQLVTLDNAGSAGEGSGISLAVLAVLRHQGRGRSL